MATEAVVPDPRPEPGPYPFDAALGDRFAKQGRPTAGASATLPHAVEFANSRAARRGCRQRLAVKRSGVGAGRWVVQDVRGPR
jgi:hypothetical protein